MHEVSEFSPLFEARLTLLKSAESGEENPKFGGIASSESEDVEGDSILRKALDISYISRRGYVNWNHSKSSEDQIGFITRAEIIPVGEVGRYEDLLQTPLSKSASMYVEGSLYRFSDKAMNVHKLLKSIPVGTEGSIGLSVEGSVARSEDGVVKAIVRGVAVTPCPAHPDTLCRLMKSVGLGLSDAVGSEVVCEALAKGLSESEAIIRVMELRPTYSLDFAKKFVKFVIQRINQPGGN